MSSSLSFTQNFVVIKYKIDIYVDGGSATRPLPREGREYPSVDHAPWSVPETKGGRSRVKDSAPKNLRICYCASTSPPLSCCGSIDWAIPREPNSLVVPLSCCVLSIV